MTTIGDLKHRVTLKGISDVIGDGGQKTRSYLTIANVWAEMKPAQIPVRTKADRVEFVTSYTITCPYSANYLTARRIELGSRIFEVQSLINLHEDQRYLVFQCEEIQN